ncbi:unnamed protein product [Parajaminaea phylloscopi]
MILPRFSNMARSAALRPAAALRVQRAGIATSMPRFSEPTASEQAAKADAYRKHHDHEDLQKETVAQHTKDRRADRITSSPNNAPTESEDVAHASKHSDDPKTLQKETVKKASGHH